MPKAKKKSKEDLIELYMEYVSVHGLDISITELCEAKKIKEEEFILHLDSIAEAEMTVWEELMQAAINTVNADPQYVSFSKRDRLLSLYYTFFENCNLNQPFLHVSLEHHGKLNMLRVLKKLKLRFSAYIKTMHEQPIVPIGRADNRLNQITNTAVAEAYYTQLLFLLDFWKNDVSVNHEKTDIAIEKTIKASMDLIDFTPIKSVVDFGKFMWKERLSNVQFKK